MKFFYKDKLLQQRREHDEFLSILKAEKVTSYMEIGSMYGGSLWKTANALPKGSRVVSVDFACDTPEALPHLEECVRELVEIGYDAHLIYGDSMEPFTVQAVSRLAPFDCVFIDGAHTEEAVRSDWANYGPMGRIVALHDIAWNSTWKSAVPGRVSKPMGVPALWEELKKTHRHKELKYHVPSNYYGIGVLWNNV
jgi:predicted O-methyltransferase YrrM